MDAEEKRLIELRERELKNAVVMHKIRDEIQANLDDVEVSWKMMDFCDNTLVIKINIDETVENGFMER
jgi:hypothetical protein